VFDLGTGSGMDTFIAALKVGCTGSVVGLDMTDERRAKAERLRDETRFANVMYVKGCIEEIPLADARFATVIRNGVIKRSADATRM
jgi:ubiquinone/menaquinone biosynthesis C-methylase UbiE